MTDEYNRYEEYNRKKSKKWYYDHREEVLAKNKIKREANKEEMNKYRREYYARNKERMQDRANTRYFKKKIETKPEFKYVQNWTKWVYVNPLCKKKLVGV